VQHLGHAAVERGRDLLVDLAGVVDGARQRRDADDLDLVLRAMSRM
jgi:hypothetical protein